MFLHIEPSIFNTLSVTLIEKALISYKKKASIKTRFISFSIRDYRYTSKWPFKRVYGSFKPFLEHPSLAH